MVLKYPQYGVPWFHEKYCQENTRELVSRQGDKADMFAKEVSDILQQVAGSWRFVREVSLSRYYNKVDFEVVLDREGRPVELYSEKGGEEEGGVRCAVQCYDQAQYTQDTRRLRGPPVLECRLLSSQGWKVVIVNPFDWNSLKLGDPAAKREHLLTQLRAAVL